MAKLEPVVRQLQQQLAEPLDFGCSTMVVSTLNGHRPTVREIAATKTRATAIPLFMSSTRQHILPSRKPREHRAEVIFGF